MSNASSKSVILPEMTGENGNLVVSALSCSKLAFHCFRMISSGRAGSSECRRRCAPAGGLPSGCESAGDVLKGLWYGLSLAAGDET